jgi:hypothetical protein
MKTQARVLLAGTAVLALSIWFLAAGTGAADEKKDVRDAVQQVADSIEKGDAAKAKQLADEVAKAHDLEDVMNLLAKRSPQTSGKKAPTAFGVGDKPGAIKPDWIEDKLRYLGRKALPKDQLEKESAALVQMSYRTAAVAEIAKNKPTEKVKTAKHKKDWADWLDEMKKSSEELASAAKAKDATAVKNAANKLNSSCNNCHGAFRDD